MDELGCFPFFFFFCHATQLVGSSSPMRDRTQALELKVPNPNYWCVCVSVTQLCLIFAIPWIVACQTPLSINSPGKNTGVGCYSLLQGIFLTPGSGPGGDCSHEIKRHLLLGRKVMTNLDSILKSIIC